MYRTRFAPSPTGPLHLGHAFSALTAATRAASQDGQFLLRIEDIDRQRARADWETLIFDDLHWLGLSWPEPVLRQSDNLPAYRAALDQLAGLGVLYPCTCSRGDIRSALSAPQEGARLIGPDGPVYPGTCRGRSFEGTPPEAAVRLDMARAVHLTGAIGFDETGPALRGHQRITPEATLAGIGDVVLARRGFGTSYHLSVVVDDAAQGITEVVRGRDLFEATDIHVVLQRLLGLPTPAYHHHDLIRDEAGKRLAKRDDARALAAYRASGLSAAELRTRLGFAPV